MMSRCFLMIAFLAICYSTAVAEFDPRYNFEAPVKRAALVLATLITSMQSRFPAP
jgi:hypothetical protein